MGPPLQYKVYGTTYIEALAFLAEHMQGLDDGAQGGALDFGPTAQDLLLGPGVTVQVPQAPITASVPLVQGLSAQEWLKMLTQMQGQASAGPRTLRLHAMQGAIARLGPSSTAFPHRSAYAMLQLSAECSSCNQAAGIQQQNQVQEEIRIQKIWIQEMAAAVKPNLGAHVRTMFTDAAVQAVHEGTEAGGTAVQAGKQGPGGAAYFGQNWQRMQDIKARYDPSHVFKSPLFPEAGTRV
uniref:Berberine/berberine-like domain-containing protein n=1 Tax=Chlamydomonas chlamydogama TaxID=225041 RepID=A0A7S2QTN8_9CHLO|mmetsp:Transcript_1816/g.4049  ORF Transcript_1816/g.4049 Transcript_1816/m.4049 type:complete len:238 (+) Transcript_1816:64-777(+)